MLRYEFYYNHQSSRSRITLAREPENGSKGSDNWYRIRLVVIDRIKIEGQNVTAAVTDSLLAFNTSSLQSVSKTTDRMRQPWTAPPDFENADGICRLCVNYSTLLESTALKLSL